MRTCLATILAVSVCAPSTFAADTPGPVVGRKIDDFELRDDRGSTHQLSDFARSKLVVVAFLGCECPLAKLYGARLGKLAAEFEPRGVAFVGINSNRQDSLTEMAAYARLQEIAFPLLKDPGNAIADRFGAARTPQVFVLDHDRAIRYSGRIDDQYLVGVRRPQPTRRDLALALEELLAGQPVTVAETPVAGCQIGRIARGTPHGEVTYSNQIARLFQRRCVECHREGEVAPFPMTNYEEIVGWGEAIREVVDEGRMPPWFANPEHGRFANDARLSDDEKQWIRAWVGAGCPEGDPAQLPEPRQFTLGWQIPEPDQVIHIQPEPVTVQADGVVKYQYFEVDPGFTEDKWIAAAEARPDNRSVVHHIVAFFVPPGEKARGGRGAMIGYAPGMPPNRFPEGAALFVPAGSKVVFQMHYTPNGKEQRDRSYVGLKFADPAQVKYRMSGGMAPNNSFEIPPGADNHEVRSTHHLTKDARLLTLTPHMHLRGKSFRYEAEYPDGTREILLDIPRYDFNWQLRYTLAEPKRLPKGTKLICTAHFDNSEKNLSNPDPTQSVRWGDQTWEEMMIGYFSTLPMETVDASPTNTEESTAGEGG
ncbi:MAG TPA: redoxin domain-containing protein [Pirellulales bacterium]|nr:redoxin domain-containing protein [Pirellulales bacterium]